MSTLSPEPCTETPDLFAPLTEAEKTPAPARMTAATEEWEPIVPAPSEPETPSGAQAMWVYRNAEGEPLFARFRYGSTNQGEATVKEVRPLTYGRRVWTDKYGRHRDLTDWHWKQPAKPLPLYGLDRLAARPDAPVLLVEGEKTADAGALLFPDYVAITSGGSTSATSADWSPLSGRGVTIWPDNDEPGEKYAQAVIEAARNAGVRSLRMVKLPSDLPAGWDIADPLPGDMASEEDATETLRTMLDNAPQAEANVKMPPGYCMTPRGLLFTPDATGDTLPMPIWVSAPFEVMAETRDEGGTGWGLLISWNDRDGKPHQWSLPKRLVHGEGKEIAGELEDAGLNCSISATRHLRQFIASVHTKTRLRCVTTGGWHKTEQGPVFVLPNGTTLGIGRRAVAFQTTRAASGAEYATAGTLEEWQRGVAAYAVGNSRVTFALSVAFCGPLLDIMGEQSGGFHIVGKSQSGKSTSLYAAGSVWGKGDRDGQVRSWRGTTNGTEGIASETSDTLLILDEMGQADSREVGDITYMLANNTGKQRAGRNGEARTRKTWRSLFLSTGEVTLATKMGEAGRRAMAGQEVRLVNIPADAGAGMGLFEALHNMPSAGDLADHIRNAARTSYGTASHAYLEALVKDRAEDEAGLSAGIKGMVGRFETNCLPGAPVDGQVRSVVRRFGLVAAAGEVATAYGVLPWPRGEATRAAKVCFHAWLEDRGGTQAAEDREAIEQVRAFIEEHGESRFTLLGNPDGEGENPHTRTNYRAGFRRLVDTPDGGCWEYLILPETWRKEVCKGMDAKRAAQALRATGYLLSDQSGKMSQSVRLPNIGKARVYVVSSAIMGGDNA
jgi:putative DNA primase/helicase